MARNETREDALVSNQLGRALRELSSCCQVVVKILAKQPFEVKILAKQPFEVKILAKQTFDVNID
jgi:hypothetical protein